MKQALVLDILFENRNKDYGAYNLRKFYDNRLMKSVAVMICVVIILSAFTFIPKKKMVAENGMYDTITTNIAPVDKKPEKKEPKEKNKAIEKPVITKKDVANIVITKDNSKADTVQTIDEKDKIGSITNIVPGSAGPGVIKPFDGESGGGEKGPDVGIAKPQILLLHLLPRLLPFLWGYLNFFAKISLMLPFRRGKKA